MEETGTPPQVHTNTIRSTLPASSMTERQQCYLAPDPKPSLLLDAKEVRSMVMMVDRTRLAVQAHILRRDVRVGLFFTRA